MKTRLEINLDILAILTAVARQHPHFDFPRLLAQCDADCFNEASDTSEEVLAAVKVQARRLFNDG